MTISIVQGDARKLDHIKTGSVHLIVTSPPYFGQRRYEDDGVSYEGQIGAESHPRYWLENLWDCAKEWWRVLDDRGSVFVNLGDKRAASGAPGTTSGLSTDPQGPRTRIAGAYSQAYFGRPKSRQLLPERFAIGCEDGLADPDGIGWIVRQVILWHKLSGLPESVQDRTRDDFEVIYHLTKSETYYSAVDELREPPSGYQRFKNAARSTPTGQRPRSMTDSTNAAGRLPGSVWSIAGEGLRIPDLFIEDERGWRMFGVARAAKGQSRATSLEDALFDVGEDQEVDLVARADLWAYAEQRYRQGCTYLRMGEVDHYASFPSEIPRRLILGWSPPAICLTCGEGRWPVVDKEPMVVKASSRRLAAQAAGRVPRTATGGTMTSAPSAAIVGYACGCTPFTDHVGNGKPSPTAGPDGRQGARPVDIGATHERVGPRREYHLSGWTAPPSRPAVVLDPFVGTGTTCGVAALLGRDSLGVDLSQDYVNLARWRCSQPDQWRRARERTWSEAQGSLAL